ncbi:hypothetical protein BMS3Bbin06_00500 [bacterium BMS3Bbin06]|nr:hypothetical protein BMS3Bbin06_00500 [bacterium BMS3Bbin06]
MAEKLKVFVAHSFEKSTPEGETHSDRDVADWFVRLLRKRPLSFQVLTGAKPVPAPIDEKVAADIADCGCVIGVFTKRHYESQLQRWLPSQFVLCECASAIGFYYNTNKLICGFYEKGIDPKDLALVTVGGLELVEFTRDDLEKDKNRFVDYLRRLPELVATGAARESQLLFRPKPYVQQRLYKIYTVYRNGRVTVQNLNTMLLTDMPRFLSEEQGKITHEIWHRRAEIPRLADMAATPISERAKKPFLNAILRSVNQKKINARFGVVPVRHDGTRAYFALSFANLAGCGVKLKNQDILRYQYAWGLLCAYPTNEEELAEPAGRGQINEHAYCVAEVFASHGLIRELVFELRFERGHGEFFSKSPFFQTTATFGDLPSWSLPQDMPKVEEEDHEMWFQTYRLAERNFNGRIRVLWRPSSAKVKAEHL